MRSCDADQSFRIEPLEQRRLLCGSGADGEVAHLADFTRAATAVPARPAGRPELKGQVVAAFARSHGGLRGGEVVWGESTVVDGALVATWAIVSRKDGSVVAAGATVPLSLAQHMPSKGSGPAGAIASLDFPAVVRDTTYFNHLEIQPEALGHVAPPGSVNPNRNFVPHFDFHFYGIPEADVLKIPLVRPPAPLPAVPADRLPAGYTQPGFSQVQMGRHAGPAWALTDPGPLTTVVLAGYVPDGSRMHFVEPMISQQVLLEQRDLALDVPTPQVFDRDTRYPTRSEVVFHGGAHHFVYSDFVDTAGARPRGGLAEPPRGGSRPAVGPSYQTVARATWTVDDEDGSDDPDEGTDGDRSAGDLVE